MSEAVIRSHPMPVELLYNDRGESDKGISFTNRSRLTVEEQAL
jgi:hypothetical protein